MEQEFKTQSPIWEAIKAAFKPGLKAFTLNFAIGAAVGLLVVAAMGWVTPYLEGTTFAKTAGSLGTNFGYAAAFFGFINGFTLGISDALKAGLQRYREVKAQNAGIEVGRVQEPSPDMELGVSPALAAAIGASAAGYDPMVGFNDKSTPSEGVSKVDRYLAMQRKKMVSGSHVQALMEQRLSDENRSATVGL